MSRDKKHQAATLPAIVTPSDYELEAIREIHATLEPDDTWLGRVKTRAYDAYNAATDQLRRIPGFDWTVENVVGGILNLINEITQDWVPQSTVFGRFAEQGHTVVDLADIRGLDLASADAVSESLPTTYRNIAAVEGAATGYVGLAGIATDIVALVALNLRAAGETATSYGFDISRDEERFFALSLLDRVAQPSTKAKNLTLSPMVSLTNRLARQQAFELLEQAALNGAISRITKSLGIHLTRAKLAQIAPVTGAVVGGGYNAYYTSRVCKTARLLYRRRFLMDKYGSAVVERYERTVD
ncbi:MAG: EcsC family protein [Rhodothermales bacterium]|nr:EcsC family protein [Rhodothermales bacterium]